ncbi:DUF551 domain-containing protein [Klebsiella pneumoniae]
MTKSTITRERLEALANAEYCKSNPGAWLLGLREVNELARMALAAMDSEPDCKERKLFCSTDTTRMRKTISVSAGTEDAPLYRHAQQPVVSADLLHTAASAIEDLLTTKDRTGAGVWFDLPFRLRSAANAQPAPVVPELRVDWQENEFSAGWNACRAAMLQELKKSAGTEAICRGDENVQVLHTKSPAQSDCCPAQNHVSPEQNGDVPAQSQGWIQVSEQMPPSRHEVLVGCCCGEKPLWCCKWATYIPGHPDAQSSGWLIPGASWTPTHWMALPAGPQEVNHG